MSDFLSQLVARSLSPVPAVQPRLRSRFEPVSDAAALPALHASAIPSKDPGPVEPFGQTFTVQQPDPSVAQTSLPKAAGPSENAGERSTALTDHSRRSADSGNPVAAQVKPRSHRLSNQDAAPVESESAQLTLRSAPRLPEVSPASSEKSEAKFTADTTESRGKDVRPAPLPVTPVSTMRVHPSVTDSLPARAATQPVARSIQVTIGRVEIRAVAPAPGPARVRPPAVTPQSLEDYLKQRRSRPA